MHAGYEAECRGGEGERERARSGVWKERGGGGLGYIGIDWVLGVGGGGEHGLVLKRRRQDRREGWGVLSAFIRRWAGAGWDIAG